MKDDSSIGYTAVVCALLAGAGGWGIAGLGVIPEGAKASDLLGFVGAIIGVVGAVLGALYVESAKTKARDREARLEMRNAINECLLMLDRMGKPFLELTPMFVSVEREAREQLLGRAIQRIDFLRQNRPNWDYQGWVWLTSVMSLMDMDKVVRSRKFTEKAGSDKWKLEVNDWLSHRIDMLEVLKPHFDRALERLAH